VNAWTKLALAGRLYGAGENEAAKAALSSAFMLDPSLLADGDQRLLDVIIGWPRNIWARDQTGLIDRVLANLPSSPALPRDLPRRVTRHQAKAAFYDAFARGDILAVRRLWTEIALWEPAWLMNRGTWSILLQSLRLFPRSRQHRERSVQPQLPSA
jgi:hypothetical protein